MSMSTFIHYPSILDTYMLIYIEIVLLERKIVMIMLHFEKP